MSSALIDLLRRASLFAELEAHELEAIALAAERQEFQRDDTIFEVNEAPDGLYVVASGRVKVCVSSAGGKELILATLGPGQFFGEMALLDHSPRSASVITQLPTVTYRVKSEDFERLIEQHPKIVRKLLRELSLRLRRSNAQMESLATLDVVGRLARYFMDLARQHGQVLGNGWVAVRRPTHQDIANTVGTSRETVTRLINDLEQRGLVVNEGKMSYLREAVLSEEA
jgi:CRP-like cAMP-binding protein